MNRKTMVLAGLGLWAWFVYSGSTGKAGDLNPPGKPASTMKTLDEVEARIPITSLPLSITASGSYYLTGDFTVAAGSGILIAADNVTLDLNGYALISSGSGSGSGIAVNNPQVNIHIKNGTIRNWPEYAVSAGNANNSRIENLRVYNNGNAGIQVGYGSIVKGCVVSSSDGVGIATSFNSSVLECVSNSNSGDGITVGLRCVVTDCAASFNGGDGMEAGSGTLISRCQAGSNTGNGFKVTYNCYVVGNDCAVNGMGDGDGAGIYVTGTHNRIEANNAVSNDRGIDVDGNYNIIIKNTARGTSPYDIAANNSYGPIVTVAGFGDMSSIANSNHPWANFSF